MICKWFCCVGFIQIVMAQHVALSPLLGSGRGMAPSLCAQAPGRPRPARSAHSARGRARHGPYDGTRPSLARHSPSPFSPATRLNSPMLVEASGAPQKRSAESAVLSVSP